MTGFSETFLMATGFLIVCLFAGSLMPKEGSAASIGAVAGEGRIEVSAPEVSAPEVSTPEGVRA